MSLINTMHVFKSMFLRGLCLFALCGQASALDQAEDKFRVFPYITVVRPLLVSHDERPECREWKDNFQFLSSSNKSDLFFRVRARDFPKSKCVAFSNVAGKSSEVLLRSPELMPEMLSGPTSQTYWTGEWRMTERVHVASIKEQLNEDEIQIYRPTDALTEAWDESCISIFDKIIIRDGSARKVYYLLAISNSYPFLRRFNGGFHCPNWPGESSASEYVATFDIDAGVFNEGAFFFDRTFGTFLLPKSRVQDFCVFISDLGITYTYLSENKLRRILGSGKVLTSVTGMNEQSFEVSRDDSRIAAVRLLKKVGKCDKW